MANIIDKIFRREPKAELKAEPGVKARTPQLLGNEVAEAQAFQRTGYWPYYSKVFSFDGEKNPGSMGSPKHYVVSYKQLGIRSWQAFLDNELANTVLKRLNHWVIGKGLRLQSMPTAELLSESLDKIAEESRKIEYLFDAWSRSTHCSHNLQENLSGLAKITYKSAKIGGDALVLLRYQDKNLNVQVLDGIHIAADLTVEPDKEGNYILNGIEYDKEGKVQIFHIFNREGVFQKIPAIEKISGLPQAFMVYGQKFRIGSNRGLPALSSTLETLNSLERYKEAVVTGAEERAKVAWTLQHNVNGTGQAPWETKLAQASNTGDTTTAQIAEDDSGEQTVNYVEATTNRTVYNLPPGAEMKTVDSKQEADFEGFYKSNAYMFCANLDIPPNVAFSLYTDSFSASRAATKDFEHTLKVERDAFSFYFYQNIYIFWLHVNIMSGRIDLPGYIEAYNRNDITKLSAYRKSRFFGAQFPHIDPLKEAKAEREKLGEEGKYMPLTTAAEATETLTGGDFELNAMKFKQEKEKLVELGLWPDDPKETD